MENNHKYVGITTQSPRRRWKRHIVDVDRLDYPLYRAIRKYGVERFRMEVLEIISTPDKQELIDRLNELEVKYIEKCRSFIGWDAGGYNLTIGGGMENISPESRRKQGQTMRLMYKNNPELVKSNGYKIHLKYKNDPNYGKNIADKLRQLYVDNPAKRQMIGDFQRGETHHSFDNKIYTFVNVKTNEHFSGTRYEFYRKYNLSPSKVCLLIKGERHTHKDWTLNNPIATHTKEQNGNILYEAVT